MTEGGEGVQGVHAHDKGGGAIACLLVGVALFQQPNSTLSQVREI